MKWQLIRRIVKQKRSENKTKRKIITNVPFDNGLIGRKPSKECRLQELICILEAQLKSLLAIVIDK